DLIPGVDTSRNQWVRQLLRRVVLLGRHLVLEDESTIEFFRVVGDVLHVLPELGPGSAVEVPHVLDTCRAFKVGVLHVINEFLVDKILDVVYNRRPVLGRPVTDRSGGTSLHHQFGGPRYEKVWREVNNTLPPLDRLSVKEVHSSSYRSSSRIY